MKTSNSSSNDLDFIVHTEEALGVIVTNDDVTELVKNTHKKKPESDIDANEKLDVYLL